MEKNVRLQRNMNCKGHIHDNELRRNRARFTKNIHFPPHFSNPSALKREVRFSNSQKLETGKNLIAKIILIHHFPTSYVCAVAFTITITI